MCLLVKFVNISSAVYLYYLFQIQSSIMNSSMVILLQKKREKEKCFSSEVLSTLRAEATFSRYELACKKLAG